MSDSKRRLWNAPARRAAFPTCMVLSALLLLPGIGRADNAPTKNPKSKITNPKSAAVPLLRASDVVATVEGKAITRRELVNYWLQTDANASALLGSLLADRWKAAKGALPVYTVSEADIYRRLFADKNVFFANVLSSLIMNHLVNIEAERQGILITQTQAADYVHQRFDIYRQEHNIQLSDAQLFQAGKLPRDVFMNEARFKVQSERLLAADIARHNGHSLRPDDWIVARELCAVARPSGGGDVEAQFDAARKRLETWVEEVKQGKPMEEAAREHNEDQTNGSDGLRGPTLRGIGTKALEDAVWALKPGELSRPLRGRAGWYVFRVERRGDQISAAERNRMWQQVLAERLPSFLTELRQSAKITSIVPLPINAPTPDVFASLGQFNPMEMPPLPPR